jgi:hypothetical protein
MSDHEIRMQYSDDGQPNFCNWDAQDIGAVGEYGKRLVWTRLGSTRQRVYRFECSSPRKRDLLDLVTAMQGADG